jgi:hypothetical protein
MGGKPTPRLRLLTVARAGMLALSLAALQRAASSEVTARKDER